VDEDFNDAFDDAGFDVSPTPEPATIGMGDYTEGEEDYTQRTTIPGTNITGFVSPQSYMEYRGATATNPFPDSIFSRIFGAENVDYTGILGGKGVQDVNNLRYRQAMGMDSQKTGMPYQMGDFYLGQPTMEGVVRDTPRGGIMSMIPGISTVANLLGRNRGLPESSEAYRRAVADANQRSANVSNFFQPLTDLISGGIESLRSRFTDPEQKDTVTNRPIARGTELGDMVMTNAFIPDSRIVVDDFANPTRTLNTRITDDGANLNTGIANVAPNKANEANMQVADALQLIQPGTLADSIGVRNFVSQKLNPELKAYIDSQPSIDQRMRELENERKERERDEQFRAEVLKSIQNSSRSQPRYVAQDPFKPFDNSGTFIPVD
jgi:hypothetical protein